MVPSILPSHHHYLPSLSLTQLNLNPINHTKQNINITNHSFTHHSFYKSQSIPSINHTSSMYIPSFLHIITNPSTIIHRNIDLRLIEIYLCVPSINSIRLTNIRNHKSYINIQNSYIIIHYMHTHIYPIPINSHQLTILS